MTAIDKIVLASSNAGKVREINKLFAGCGIEVVPQSDFTVPDVPETGTTFVENAIIKARHAAECTGLPAIADDSGIEVDALQGPGYGPHVLPVKTPATVITTTRCWRNSRVLPKPNARRVTSA